MSTDMLYELKDKLPIFLKNMKGKGGFYRYSLSGDLCDENIHWGLGNSIFALRLYYMIDSLEYADVDEIYDFVISFQKSDGYIYDDHLYKKAFSLRKFLRSIKNLRFRNLFPSENRKSAETRQAFSSLFMINKKPPAPLYNFPQSEKTIEEHLSSLNWNMPWGAGSHFSHLIFFLFNMKKHYPSYFDYDADELINYALEWVNRIQNDDGCWYIGNTTLNQKINGAMKIITGLSIIAVPINNPEKIVDTALSAINDRHACDNFNIVYVLYNGAKQLNFSYRQNEIETFFEDRLRLYRRYYYEDIGGFSFHPNKSNEYYYGSKVTKGLDEPDIHGTMMFMWGTSLIAEVLGINKEIGLKSFIP